jgi:hypothetical protein
LQHPAAGDAVTKNGANKALPPAGKTLRAKFNDYAVARGLASG